MGNVVGKKPRAAARVEGRFDHRTREKHNTGGGSGHHPRTHRTLGQQRRKPDDAARPDPVVGRPAHPVGIGPDVDLALEYHENLGRRLGERIDDQLTRRELTNTRRGSDLLQQVVIEGIEGRTAGEKPGKLTLSCAGV